jgi:hypothetical protein
MQCIWRTKESNFWKRCTRQTRFLFCRQHAWKPFSVIAAVIIILGAISEFTGFNLRDLFLKSPVQPHITCSMEYPIKIEDDKVFRDKHNPEIVISNNGPVKALSVSGEVEAYRYDSKKDEITGFINQGIRIARDDKAGQESLAQYIMRNAFADLSVARRGRKLPTISRTDKDHQPANTDSGHLTNRQMARQPLFARHREFMRAGSLKKRFSINIVYQQVPWGRHNAQFLGL